MSRLIVATRPLLLAVDVSADATGVYEEVVGGRRTITGGRAESLRWDR